METRKTPNNQGNLEKEEWSSRNQLSDKVGMELEEYKNWSWRNQSSYKRCK